MTIMHECIWQLFRIFQDGPVSLKEKLKASQKAALNNSIRQVLRCHSNMKVTGWDRVRAECCSNSPCSPSPCLHCSEMLLRHVLAPALEGQTGPGPIQRGHKEAQCSLGRERKGRMAHLMGNINRPDPQKADGWVKP